MTSRQRPRQHQHHPAVRPEPRHRRRHRGRRRPPSPRPCRCCRRACRRRRRSARTTRRTSRSCFSACTSTTLPLSALDDYAETMVAQRISMVERRRAGAGAGRGEVRRARAGRSRQAPRAAASASTKSTRRCTTGTSTCRPGTLFGPTSTFNIKANGQLMNADALQAADRLLSQRRAGAARRGRQRHRQRRRRQERLLDLYGGERQPTAARRSTLQVMRQPGSNTIEVTDAVKRAAARASERSCRPRSTSTSAATARRTIREAFNDIQFTMVVTLALVIVVIFLFLRNGSATMIPALALPFSILGTFAVMYLLRLQPEQPLDDGADPLDRLRRGRRHRDAREHRAAHRERREAVAGGAQRIARDRLHDRLDDRCRWPRCSSRFCSWAASSAGCSANSPSPSATAILISGVVSITLTPMLCSRFLRVVHSKKGFAG